MYLDHAGLTFRAGNWIAEVRHGQRACGPGEDARSCSRQPLLFADGIRLSIDAAQISGGLLDAVFSNTTVTQEAAQPAPFSSECLRDHMRTARERGWRLSYYDQLFSATTVFLGYDFSCRGDRVATIDLANGSCYLSPTTPSP